jgi:hypothetical protein
MAVATFLDLCQQVVEDAGISGTFTSVANQTGEFRRVVNWVARATTEVEGLWFNWDFLHVFYTFNTVASVRDYPAPNDLNLWDEVTAKLPAREQRLESNQWEVKKLDPTAEFDGDPFEFVVLPDKSLRLYNTPTSVLQVDIEYWKQPTQLVNNTDTPAIPLQFRDIIVYKALQFYANYESADEVKIQAVENYQSRLAQLESHSLPGFQASGKVNTGTNIEVIAPGAYQDYYR